MTMLAPSRYHRAEVKYNVATEFPHLGLHSASASGDIGLVQYALSHGQPINSVLDGVLPLHAACAGGNDIVVNLLIAHGADVNAGRLPRRYSDRNRDATAPIVGTSGSTPLHFAAANGHLTVVRTLLSHGAHPDRTDKHGVTPELIARQNGWIECANLLAQCVALARERERAARGESTPESDGAYRERAGSLCPIDHLEASIRKRLHLKRSIDHALGTLKSGTGTPDIEYQRPQLPPVLQHSLSDQDTALDPRSGNNSSPFSPPPETSGRRPSLPHIYDEAPPPPSFASRTRRPRSAGAGAEQQPPPPPRKVNSKISLLSLFRKSNIDGSPSSVASAAEQRARSPPSPLPVPYTSSPAPRPTALPVSPRSLPIPLSSPRDVPRLEYQRHRLESTASSSSGRSYPTEPLNALVADGARHRSASGASMSSVQGDDQYGDGNPTGVPAPRGRAGILKMHNRSSSSGHGSAAQSASLSRIIRFEPSTSSISSLASRTRSPSSRGVQPDNRLRGLSMGSNGQRDDDYDGIPDTIEESPVVPPQPAPPVYVDHADYNDEEPEEEYGIPIMRSPENPSDLMLSPDRPLAVSGHLPFNINVPPPTDDVVVVAPPGAASDPTLDSLLESRLRGDSVSSASTTATTSTHPQSSSASDAAWSVATPNTPQIFLNPIIVTNSVEMEADGAVVREAKDNKEPSREPDPPPPPRRSHLPPHIDISSISSHAQAEELVQFTQQSILNMEQYLDQHVQRDAETGRTPLSAKLAAYGESLAIERRLKERASAKALDEIVRSTSDGALRGYSPAGGGGRSFLSASKPTARRGDVPRRSIDSRSSSESTSLDDRHSYDHARRTTRSVSADIRRARSPPRGYPAPSTTTPDLLLYAPPRSRADGDIDSEEYLNLTRGIAPHPLPLSRVSSTPSYDFMRASTTTPSSTTIPPSFSSPSSLTVRRPHHHHARDRDPTRSAQKLSRMGFSTMDGWHHSSPFKNGSRPATAMSMPPAGAGGITMPSTTTTTTGGTRSSPGPRHRFGGIRTIMQSLRGE
ncbi:hypothetical protein F5I97DRAFT_683933 [Phlebopus sp. FC_14]|nr:hypothetical protein F5I97DRAFT_683933 [Phlebopus sp. FC_14]